MKEQCAPTGWGGSREWKQLAVLKEKCALTVQRVCMSTAPAYPNA